MQMKSFTLNPGQDIFVKRTAAPKVSTNIAWQKTAGGSFVPIDRGAAGVVHESAMTAFGTRDQVEVLRAFLDARADQAIDLLDVQDPLFCPLIDHSTDLTAFVTPSSPAQFEFVRGQGGYYEMPLSMRAVQYSYFDVEGSLASLIQRSAFQAGRDFQTAPRWSYGNVPSPANPLTAEGLFVEEFYQMQAETKAILKYLLVDNRGLSIPFPSLPGVNYPFGRAAGAAPRCHVVGLEIKRANLHFWTLKISFAETAR